ncbi:MAG: SPOR domain-containing protein, partial [Sandaracinobacteroides sp.]
SHMTRLYNQFADPDAQSAFCAVAAAEVKRAIAEEPQAFEAGARQALARLDSPFADPPRLAFAGKSAPSAAIGPAPVAGIPAGWRIQLGAFGSPSAAQSAWVNVKSRSPALAGMTPHFEPVPGKPLVRLQVKGVESRAQAVELCAHAAAAGFDCLPVKAG